MTEPIKLPDFEGMEKAFHRLVEAHHDKRSPFHSPVVDDAMIALRELRGARLAVERATAEHRAEVERLREELDRLTTLRPHACDDEYDGEKLYWGKDGNTWICDPLFVRSTHWTPLPEPKETK